MHQGSLLGQSLLATFLRHLVNSLHMHALPGFFSADCCVPQKYPMFLCVALLHILKIYSLCADKSGIVF